MQILIDSDIVCYRCAASCEPSKTKAINKEDPNLAIITEPLYVAIGRVESMMDKILQNCGTTNYRAFLSGSNNFRHKIYPLYKANRANTKRPTWLEQCKEHLFTQWKAEITDGYEADDGIGIAHNRDTSIVASIDKDLLQLPGNHYNFVKDEHRHISSVDAERKIWELMLIGDTSDNIRGVDRIGVKRTQEILDAGSATDWHEIVYNLYSDPHRFKLNLRLITVLRTNEEAQEVLTLHENSFSKSQGQDTSEIGEGQDIGPFGTINS